MQAPKEKKKKKTKAEIEEEQRKLEEEARLAEEGQQPLFFCPSQQPQPCASGSFAFPVQGQLKHMRHAHDRIAFIIETADRITDHGSCMPGQW